MNFAIVVSRFNQSVTQRLLDGAVKTFRKNGVPAKNIKILWVPGAYEIPLVAQKLARSKKYAAVLALGCVLKGETTHNDYIASAVAHGLMRVGLDSGVPVIFGVLTPNTMKQAQARSGNDSANKGSESAEAALEMAAILRNS